MQMEMKKSVLGFSAKLALLIMVVCSLVLTSCYDKVAPVAPPEEVPTYYLSGTVIDNETNQVIPNFNITITPAQSGNITVSNGAFKAQLPSYGNYMVKITADGYTDFTASVNINQIQNGSYTENLLVRLNKITEDPEPNEPSYYLAGTVLDKDTRQPISGLTIDVTLDGKVIDVTVNADGTFTAKLPSEGSYKVVFSAPGYNSETEVINIEKAGDSEVFTYSMSIFLSKTETPAEPKYFVKGNVIDAITESPIANLSIVITPAQVGDITISNGNFNAQLPSFGKYSLEFSAPGYKSYTATIDINEIGEGETYTENLVIRLKYIDTHDSHGDDSHGGDSHDGHGGNNAGGGAGDNA
jgi:hypothetical protein